MSKGTKKASHRTSFSSSIGFVLAAAGSAVGLGNIWRFPYLAAKDGGGLFLVMYIVLALTFGFTLLSTELAIGRKTKASPLTAYKKLSEKWGFLGIIGDAVSVTLGISQAQGSESESRRAAKHPQRISSAGVFSSSVRVIEITRSLPRLRQPGGCTWQDHGCWHRRPSA